MLSHQRNFIIISSFRSPLRFVYVFMRARKLVYCERIDVSLVERVSRQVQRLSCCRLWLECMWRNSTSTTFIIRLLHLTKHFIIFHTSYYCECVSITWLLKNNTGILWYNTKFQTKSILQLFTIIQPIEKIWVRENDLNYCIALCTIQVVNFHSKLFLSQSMDNFLNHWK